MVLQRRKSHPPKQYKKQRFFGIVYSLVNIIADSEVRRLKIATDISQLGWDKAGNRSKLNEKSAHVLCVCVLSKRKMPGFF